ncbi:hypothetical protein LSPH24S_02794 [Lysinibacillus sphaericus]
MEKSKKKELLDWVKSTVITCVIVIATMAFIVSPTRVGGASINVNVLKMKHSSR